MNQKSKPKWIYNILKLCCLVSLYMLNSSSSKGSMEWATTFLVWNITGPLLIWNNSSLYQSCNFLMPNCCCVRCFQVVCHVAGLTWGDVTMCGWGTDVWSSRDDRDSWRSGSEGREGQHRCYRSLWLHKHTNIQPTTHQYCNAMLYHFRLMINTLLTGGLGRFFLLVVDLEPEKRLFRAANAALALATFLLGPVPRKTCLSTSTCYNTQRGVCLLIIFRSNVPLMFVTRL